MKTQKWLRWGIDRKTPPEGLVRVRLREGHEFDVDAGMICWDIRNSESDIVKFKLVEKKLTVHEAKFWDHWEGGEIPSGKVHVLLKSEKVLTGYADQFNWSFDKHLDHVVSYKTIIEDRI